MLNWARRVQPTSRKTMAVTCLSVTWRLKPKYWIWLFFSQTFFFLCVLPVLIQAGNKTPKLMRSLTSVWSKEKMSLWFRDCVKTEIVSKYVCLEKMKCLHLQLGNPHPCISPFKVKFWLTFQFPTANPTVFRQLLYELQMFIAFRLLTGFVYEQLKNNRVLNEDFIC